MQKFEMPEDPRCDVVDTDGYLWTYDDRSASYTSRFMKRSWRHLLHVYGPLTRYVSPRATVTTQEEYAEAPEGSVVAGDGMVDVYVKWNDLQWRSSGLIGGYLDRELAGRTRKVLRWGPFDTSTPVV